LIKIEKMALKGLEINLGECSECNWKNIIKDRIKENPDYIPYGGRRKCIDNKNYKNCPGFIPIPDKIGLYSL
jgi:hypothetical protein